VVAALVVGFFTPRHDTARTPYGGTQEPTRVHTGANRKRNEHRPLNDVSLTGGPMIILRQQMRSKPERTEDVWAALAAIVPGARATPGVITLDIARDLLDPDSFVATAVYDDAAAVERQESAPEVHAAMSMFRDALAAPPDRKFYDASRDPSLV
jgi:quinol monooxygenase YgiN